MRRFLALAVLVTLCAGLLLVDPTPARALSSGCSALPINRTSTASAAIFSFVGDFAAGETITATASNSTTLAATLQVPSLSVLIISPIKAGATSASYTFTSPATGVRIYYGYGYNTPTPAGAVTAYFSLSCGILPPPSTATAEPRFEGPGIPAGFVLRTMTCTTPIYNTPKGKPVADYQVTSGQTWYVNPTPVDGWVEGFFGGYTNGWIPQACVG